MKYIHYLYIGALAFLTACSGEERATMAPDVPDDGAIRLSAGIVEGGSAATTRAGAEDNHESHLNLTNNTALALQVSGTWTDHLPETVVKTTTATVGAVTGADDKHNALTCSPVLYWDDYGTADPENATTGRTMGLTIYGVAVDGKTTAPTVTDWTALSWTLAADQTASGSTPADKDLLISNNVKAGTGDGTYKFAERASGKLLEFRHALSKITVNLKAGDGFTGSAFAAAPEVKLTSNTASTSAAEWAYTSGTINVTTGVVSSQSAPAVITMWQAATAATGYTVTKEALIIPGSQFTSDNAIIAKITADGNIYYVTAEKIRTAINSSHATGEPYLTAAGKNYIINVTVNKTDIEVTATVVNWTDVASENVSPVINVSGNLGTASSDLSNGSYSFYRSTALNNGYSNASSLKVNDYYAAESVITKDGSSWFMSPVLYWPNHNTHYQFRAVSPQTVTTAGDVASPRVEDGTGSSSGYQVIKVSNTAYNSSTFPSNLMIARPEVADAAQNCGNNETGHTKKNLYTEGICAREGTINLNFRYMMSQVEVILSTSADDADDKVNLSNAKVEIVNVYNSGDVKLGDRDVILTGSTGSYVLNGVTGDGNANKRLSAIVPQLLTYTSALADGNVKFRITIYQTGSSSVIDDIYYADVNPILKSGSATDKVAPNGKWEAGVHYVYNLNLTKTEVKVTATLTDWTTLNASQEIWF